MGYCCKKQGRRLADNHCFKIAFLQRSLGCLIDMKLLGYLSLTFFSFFNIFKSIFPIAQVICHFLKHLNLLYVC